MRLLRLVVPTACFAAFVYLFDTTRDQRLVDGLWMGGLLLWVVEIGRRSGGALIGGRVQRADVVPIAVLLVVFMAAWLPFYDNWRWAFTGDSFSVFGAGHWTVLRGLRQNILSVHGMEDSFTYLWELTYDLPMFIFGPTF